jgi:hypothetical protein
MHQSACFAPFCHGTSAGEFGVVGVSYNDQHSLEIVSSDWGGWV